jgi:NNP family nitrate/nitrite transporter-like MFS transporter
MGAMTEHGATVAGTSTRGRAVRLALAFWAVLLNTWAWTMLIPLAPGNMADIELSGAERTILVVVPLLTGAFGAIPVGALTDRHGGQTMFPVVCFLAFFPVLYLAFMDTSFTFMVAGALALGVAGTAVAVAVPATAAWYARSHRGLVAGIAGAATGGVALSGLINPPLADTIGRNWTFLMIAGLLAVTGALTLMFSRDAPGLGRNNSGRDPSEDFVGAQVRAAREREATRRVWPPYTVAFGGFLAMVIYLPTYLRDVHGTDPRDAVTHAAAFAVGAVAARPLGGYLADRFGPRPVLMSAFGVAAVLTLVVALEPATGTAATVTFVLLALMLGLAAGATFAVMTQTAEASELGVTTGLATAAGVLGALGAAVLMGAAHALTGSYLTGLLILAVAALAAALSGAIVPERRPPGRTPDEADGGERPAPDR